MNNENNINVDLGRVSVEDIVSKAGISGVLDHRTSKLICTNLDNMNHVIGAYFLTADMDDIKKIRVESDDIKDDSIIIINNYQIITLIEMVNGFITILKENGLLNNYNYNLILKDTISTTKNFNIVMVSELNRLISPLGSLLEHELEYVANGDTEKHNAIKDIVEKFKYMIKYYWYIPEGELNRIHEKMVDKFEEEKQTDE